MKGSGGRSPATPALYEEESLAKKALSISELEAQSAKEEEDAFLEQRARWLGVLVAVLGAALMVLAAVLGAEPW